MVVDYENFDDNICKNFRNFQLIGKPTSKYENLNEYSKKFVNYAYEFLYGNETAAEALRKIDNLTRIHYLSMNPKKSTLGFISTVIVAIIILLISLSLFILYVHKYKSFFAFLSIDFWIISIIGIIIILCTIFTNFGPRSSFKCSLFDILLIIGSTFNIIPFFYKLIVNFPEFNKVSKWVFNHQYGFFSIFVIIDVILISLYSIKNYDIVDVIIHEGENFQKCEIHHTFGLIMISIILFYKFVVVIGMLLLIFAEWNIELIFYDVRFIVTSIYIDTLSIALMLILYHININNYIIYFVINGLITLIIPTFNYILLFGVRLILPLFKKEEEIILYINTIHNLQQKNNEINYSSNIIKDSDIINSSTINNNSINTSDCNCKSIMSNNSRNSDTSFYSKLVNYHYRKQSIKSTERYSINNSCEKKDTLVCERKKS
ncbi:hypothetical protein LY90DRAFT_647971 [Neocallimastix californiae]|uniref:G-protein coupled receptors family 3 profile domain-containing protein n=1 Tax=Neocallimastix californiae TaxID=1754190 RepID=A0A1Y2D4B0_9FUNG|nr:hypothetical protein LY90DRAFT_647971 [Neocallimastix californiae]|eukprot:ORY53974.1 hypothetical protein LY90DRAFT_647971 [Neocallimastix californiae]